MINNLRVSEINVLQTTCDKESMSENNNKQRAGHGLTHVTDKTFNFFCTFNTDTCLCYSLIVAILSDQTLSDKWKNLFTPGEEETSIGNQLYLNLIDELFRYVV